MFNKVKSIPYKRYLELVRPEYIYLKITPDKSIRNYNSSNIAKAITHTYKSIDKRIKREQKKIWIETNFKISYVIDIQKNDVGFYFIVPQCFKNILIEKMAEIWSKATIEEVEKLSGYTAPVLFEMTYKKEDALSLAVDKKSNEPLNSMLSVVDIMKDDDRVTIVTNFIPRSQLGWKKQYQDTINKLKESQPIDREKMCASYILKLSLTGLVSILDSMLEILNDFTGNTKKVKNESLAEVVATMLIQEKELSYNTKKKKELNVVDAEIVVISDSKDKTRQYNNATSVCQGYSVLDEDNELTYREYKPKKELDLNDYRFTSNVNTLSIDECHNFIQVPGRTLLNHFNINHIKATETEVPKELREGTKNLGEVTTKGVKTIAYLENDYNVGNLPLVLIGPQGGGKSTYISNYCNYCFKADESVVVLDFIKNCEVSESIKKVVPKDRIVEIDLGKEKDLQGFGYNEISINDSMSIFEKIEVANMQSQQLMNLVDSIVVGEPLSSKMRNILCSAATVTFVAGLNSVKDVVKTLEDEAQRCNLVAKLDKKMFKHLEEEVKVLMSLNDYDKKTGEVIGTKDSKIEFVVDRISMLREDFKLKFMYNKGCENNINLVECMEQNKIVLIKMRDSDFPNKMAKNILITYWVSKVWLASQLRGKLHDKPNRTNVIIDEVFQAPTSLSMLEYILPQSRKFGLKWVFSTQYMKQLKQISDALDASGSSYMMLRGSTEQDFNCFKGKIGDKFEYEDLKDAGEYTSLNLIYYSEGYWSGISKLPKPIN
ncbi:MAG: hypothetical protein RR782_02775 [Clostridium sp.]